MQPSATRSDDTRERLIRAALQAFAQVGIEATSVRTINRTADSRHQSAVYYHFGDKWGLVSATLDFSSDAMLAEQAAALTRLEQAGTAEVREILRAIVEPFLKMAAAEIGRQRLMLMARLCGEAGERGQALLAAKMRPLAGQAERMLQQCLPQQPADAIGTKLLYGLNALIHTLADRGMQEFWGLGAVSKAQLRAHLLDFLEGGLRHYRAPEDAS